MSDELHINFLKQGVRAWNQWRRENPGIKPDLVKADLRSADLRAYDLTAAELAVANLEKANLEGTTLTGADLRGANLQAVNLNSADLQEADLEGAILNLANLGGANLRSANVSSAYLGGAILFFTNLEKATLTGAHVYGISVWDTNLTGAKQTDLVITHDKQPKVTVDNLNMAQFIHLLLDNEEIRDVIDTVTSKAVLILGRFTPERKKVLDAIRSALRLRNYCPIMFDFDKPESKNVTDTVKLLAQMAKYIIVDLSDPNSAPYELGVISMLGLDTTPVLPIIEASQRPFPMLDDVQRKPWCASLHKYTDLEHLMKTLGTKVIDVAEAKLIEIGRL